MSEGNLTETWRLLRQRLALSQADAARALDVSYATVYRWEHENRVPKMAVLALIALAQRQDV